MKSLWNTLLKNHKKICIISKLVPAPLTKKSEIINHNRIKTKILVWLIILWFTYIKQMDLLPTIKIHAKLCWPFLAPQNVLFAVALFFNPTQKKNLLMHTWNKWNSFLLLFNAINSLYKKFMHLIHCTSFLKDCRFSIKIFKNPTVQYHQELQNKISSIQKLI